MRELNKPDIDALARRFQVVHSAFRQLTFEHYLVCPDVYDERAWQKVKDWADNPRLVPESDFSIHLN